MKKSKKQYGGKEKLSVALEVLSSKGCSSVDMQASQPKPKLGKTLG